MRLLKHVEWGNFPAEVEIPLSAFAVSSEQSSLLPLNSTHSLAFTPKKSSLVGFANEVKKTAFAP